MIQLGDTTDSILKIKDLVKLISNREDEINIKIDDLKILYKFQSVFWIDSFRKVVRDYRNMNGRENLNEELTLILKGISYFSRFYESNQVILDQVDIHDLIEKEVDIYVKEEQSINKEVVKLSKKISDLSIQIDSKANQLYYVHPEVQKLVTLDTVLIEERIEIKKEQRRKNVIYKEQLSINTKISRFSEISKSYSLLKGLIEEEFLEPNNYFSKSLSEESLNFLNSLFVPHLNPTTANQLLNRIHNSGLSIKFKKGKKHKMCYLINILSKIIEDEEKSSIWREDMRLYLNIEKSIYDRKFKSSADDDFKKSVGQIVDELK